MFDDHLVDPIPHRRRANVDDPPDDAGALLFGLVAPDVPADIDGVKIVCRGDDGSPRIPRARPLIGMYRFETELKFRGSLRGIARRAKALDLVKQEVVPVGRQAVGAVPEKGDRRRGAMGARGVYFDRSPIQVALELIYGKIVVTRKTFERYDLESVALIPIEVPASDGGLVEVAAFTVFGRQEKITRDEHTGTASAPPAVTFVGQERNPGRGGPHPGAIDNRCTIRQRQDREDRCRERKDDHARVSDDPSCPERVPSRTLSGLLDFVKVH